MKDVGAIEVVTGILLMNLIPIVDCCLDSLNYGSGVRFGCWVMIRVMIRVMVWI